jgi:hypothetical protein
VRPKDRDLAGELDVKLHTFHNHIRKLPGIRAAANRKAFIEQLVESIHRVKYVLVIRKRNTAKARADPSSDLFDPVKAAVLHHRAGQIDEACWLIFLFVHFGKHGRTAYRLARDVYGRLGSASHWDWAQVSANPQRFRKWLAIHEKALRGSDGVVRHFGNHRRYESLDASSPNGTGAVVESYVAWIGVAKSHEVLIQSAYAHAGGDPRKTFDHLYHSMSAVTRFGRLAKFDYLAMLGKLGLAAIEPGSAYLQDATGPMRGARLMFGTSRMNATSLNDSLSQLASQLGLDFGMQVLEDALCNWQKSPAKFIPFRG